ncbi:rhombotarget lipoprotein [Shewanella youngdeokensis]|uniref:Rhombotarget lipoprotein n=1 Tax=Shewanella youngdeokensis TaxID=2999068 RepID=A0ABZ0K1T3_9GAMM|nr:rhombotarget lipoprotein [Shewanella sp. DAU334]
MKLKLVTILSLCLLTVSCSHFISHNTSKNKVSSSLVDFLYPNDNSRTEHRPELPTLTLPVKIGLAFVPSKNWQQNGMSKNLQLTLLESVKQSFLQYDYIDRIEIIPSTYLNGGEGFTTLEQVSRLYDVDLMALVSYDQITQSHENNAALLYWTIVGMYVIPGNENTIQTFVDTAVFDVKSQKMLLRAPGISKLEQRSTAIGIDSTMTEQSLQGFDIAVKNMNSNLHTELKTFKQRVKEEKIANVERREGYSGGAINGLIISGLMLLLCIRRRTW